MKIGEPKPLPGVFLVVIVAEDENGQIVVLGDEEYPGEEAVFMSNDPDIPGLVDAFREVYGPSVRAMPSRDLDLLADVRDLVNGCEVEGDLAGLPDDLAEWADSAEFTEDD